MVRHFLDIDLLDRQTLRAILDQASMLKSDRQGGASRLGIPPGKTLAMIFEHPSTRTRVSFEVAINQLGGQSVVLNRSDMQLGRGETIADTARVLSRYVDAIMLRTGPHEMLSELAEHASVPVINGLTCRSHPCQVMADVMTFEERKGPIAGKTLAWIGDGNNVANSWIHAAARFGCTLRIATPQELAPAPEILAWAEQEGASIEAGSDPDRACRDADCLMTDVWVSMGDSDEEKRKHLLRPFQVDGRLMQSAKPDAIFMHCLPAHRGDEVTADVIDGPQSAVWDEAENRLHVQKAILAWCFSAKLPGAKAERQSLEAD